MLCFSVSSANSFDNIYMKWLPEITHFSPAPYILVGLKADHRDDPEIVHPHPPMELTSSLLNLLRCGFLFAGRVASGEGRFIYYNGAGEKVC